MMRETGGTHSCVLAVADAIRVGEDAEVTTPELVRHRIARLLAHLPACVLACALAKAGSVLGDEVD